MIRKTVQATKAATFAILLPNSSKQGMPTPTGTGFFVSPQGHFITAAHVITINQGVAARVRPDIDQMVLEKEYHAGEIPIMLQAVSLLDIESSCDVALLKVDFPANANKVWLVGRQDFPYINISTRLLEDGEPVYAFGYPLSEGGVTINNPNVTMGFTALSPRVTSAIVASSLESTSMVMTSNDRLQYVLDKALNYGNSGGPIVATDTGRVHALCTHFQPVIIPQRHLPEIRGQRIDIEIPSLYGVVSSLANPSVQKLLSKYSVEVLAD